MASAAAIPLSLRFASAPPHESGESMRVMQRAAQASANFEFHAFNFMGTIQWAQFILSRFNKLDEEIMRRCFFLLAQSYAALPGGAAASAAWRKEFLKVL
jgi:hypothetical protein